MICPVRGTRPEVGFSPAIPQKCDGTRMLPAVSLPISKGAPPAAIMAADPPLEPPEDRLTSQGLFVRPKIRLEHSQDQVNSGVLVFPTKMAPASFSLRTAVASSLGI